MRFVVFADSGCNLPQRKLQELGIEVVPFSYELDGELIVCPKYPDGFDGRAIIIVCDRELRSKPR